MIYTFGDDMRLTAMIYQACGLDKKTTGRNLSFFVLYSQFRCHDEKVNKIKISPIQRDFQVHPK